jgi:hypothetical protein
MFVKADLTVGMPLSAAKEALEQALADGGLVAESRRAVADGLVFVMSVGPRGSQVLAREVVVRLLAGHDVDQRFLVPLRWEATGPGGRMFPALDADLGSLPGIARMPPNCPSWAAMSHPWVGWAALWTGPSCRELLQPP